MHDYPHPAALDDAAVVFIALELSKSAWLVAAHRLPSGKASSHRLNGGDVAGLLALIDRSRTREAGGAPARVVLGYEAGYDGFRLQRRLAAEGINCCVMDAASLQVDRRARRAKTDRLDAGRLLRALMAWWRGDRAGGRAAHTPRAPAPDRRACPARQPHQGAALDPGDLR